MSDLRPCVEPGCPIKTAIGESSDGKVRCARHSNQFHFPKEWGRLKSGDVCKEGKA